MANYSHLQKIDGLQFIPVNDKKQSNVKEWQQSTKKHDLTNCYGVGLVCGTISGNIEVLDIDLKYDLTGKLYNQFKNSIHEADPNLLSNLVVQSTQSKGYHFIYRCSTIDGNLKLAQRHATEEEKKVGDKIKVLLETRGDKGYIVCAPTPGYEVVYGSLTDIKQITVEQRDLLFSIAYTFNEVQKEFKPPVFQQKKATKGLKPTEDYNDRGDVVGLLVEYGWSVVGKRGTKILMRRPGDTTASQSGNYDEEKKWFSVFSTSTEFNSQSPYQPYAVYGVLKCKSDWDKVPKSLYDDGYGDRIEDVKDNSLSIASQIDVTDDDLSFLATEDDYNDYLHKWRTGKFELGKPTGIPTLDNHFLFKEGNLVIINGVDNVGKSSVVWYLSMLSSLFHDWKWLIFSSENRVGGVVRKLIEFYWSEPIDTMSEEKYQIAKKHVKDNYDIIKCRDSMYNYQDILNMTMKAYKKKKYKGLMIDPYNSLKVDIPIKSKQNGYDYHYEAASVIQLFCKQYNIATYLNCHVGTLGARNKDKHGFTKAPQKEDTEGGVMFANKADEFLTIHRVTQDEKSWMFTEIHVRKIKETETGGKVTYAYQPVDLRMVNYYSGFETATGRDIHSSGYNPIKEYHKKKSESNQPVIDFTKPVNISYDYKPTDEEDAPAPF